MEIVDFAAAGAAIDFSDDGAVSPEVEPATPDVVDETDVPEDVLDAVDGEEGDDSDDFEGDEDSDEEGSEEDEETDDDDGDGEDADEPTGQQWQQHRRLQKRLKREQRDHQAKVDKFSRDQEEVENYWRRVSSSPKQFLNEYARRSGMSKREIFGKWAAEGVDSMNDAPRTEAEYQEQARQNHANERRQAHQQAQAQEQQHFRTMVDNHATVALEIATDPKYAEMFPNVAELADDQIYNLVGMDVGRALQNGDNLSFEEILTSLDKRLEREYQEGEARRGRGRKQRSVNSAEGRERPRKKARSISGADSGGGGVSPHAVSRDRFARAGQAIPDL